MADIEREQMSMMAVLSTTSLMRSGTMCNKTAVEKLDRYNNRPVDKIALEALLWYNGNKGRGK